MFRLKPPTWYLKSTIGNITLISRFRKRPSESSSSSLSEAAPGPEEQVFNFWVEYLADACQEDPGDSIRFPVRVSFNILNARMRSQCCCCCSFLSCRS